MAHMLLFLKYKREKLLWEFCLSMLENEVSNSVNFHSIITK